MPEPLVTDDRRQNYAAVPGGNLLSLGQDPVLTTHSYYLVEVESPHLFLFDELFRGTNAVERIATAEAVLSVLIADG